MPIVALICFSIILLILLVMALSRNSLSMVAIRRLAADVDSGLSHRVKTYIRSRETYSLALHISLGLTVAAIVLIMYNLPLEPGGYKRILIIFAGSTAIVVLMTAIAGILAAVDPERAFLWSLRPGRLLVLCLGFISVPLGRIMKGRLEAFRQKEDPEDEDKDEEISALISVGKSEGILEGEDFDLIRGVLEFGDTVVREVMIPRMDMVCLPADTPIKKVAERLAQARHTRLPVYEGQVDNVIGIAYLKDFLGAILDGRISEPVKNHIRPVSFVPENKPISMLLREFQQDKQQMAVIVDEYGGIDGLVTTEDLLEEIVGEIQDYEEEEGEPFREVSPGVFDVQGKVRVDELAELLGVELPERNYDSTAGWISTSLGVIPKTGTKVQLDGVDVEILSADKKRINSVRVKVNRLGN